MAHDTGTLTGTFQKPDGTTPPARTQVHITPNVPVVRDAVGNVVISGSVAVELDSDGAFSVVLAATDDDTLDPTGFAYTVDPRLKGWQPLTGVAVPANTTVDVADIVSVNPDAPEYAPWIYGEGQTFTEDVARPGLFVLTDGGNDRLVEDPDRPGLYILAEGTTADDEFVTWNPDTETLPQVVEDRISTLAAGGLLAENNLDDLDSAPTARTNLGLGTSATKDVPASGNASASQVVKGDDSRLTDSRTPAAHKASHATAGADALSPSDIGGLAASNNLSDVANTATARTNLGLGSAAQSNTAAFQAADTELSAIASTTSAANKLPYFTGSGTATTTDLTAFGRALIDDPDAATARSSLGLGSAATSASTDFQAADTELTALAGTTSAANKLPYYTGSGTATTTDLSAFGRSLIDDADAATARTTLGVGAASETASGIIEIATQVEVDAGTDAVRAITPVTLAQAQTNLATNFAELLASDYSTTEAADGRYQPLDDDLTALGGLTSAANKLPYFTGSHTAATTDLTSTARSLLDDTSTSAMLTTLGAAPTASPTFTGTVSGITASMVGLGSVNNTADSAKPVSTAQQTALDLKANLASPTFTGTVSGITASMVSAVPTTRTLTAGYGLTGLGDLSANRTPAVSLSYVTSVLSVDVSLPAATTTTITSLTLAVGTWLITASATLQAGATTTPTAEMQVVAGTATVTFDGPRSAGGRSAAVNQPLSPAIGGCVATVTVAGTVRLDCTVGASTAFTAKASTVGSTLAGATGMTATRLA